jgi:starvation-inducible DNA-binding protein
MAEKVTTGISDNARADLARTLSELLAGSYTLYVKTHGFHWNVRGPQFSTLHLLFETQYTELATAVDEIAERIRALGHDAPGSFAQFAKLSPIAEQTASLSAEAMVKELMADHEKLAKAFRKLASDASDADDEATAGLAADRVGIHEKTAWMLRATAG